MTATRRLILIRHAKSGWDDPFADDHGRKLTDRGHQAAQAIGAWLNEHSYLPDMILCSDATRTAQTASDIGQALTKKPGLRFVPGLYHAAPDTICQIGKTDQGQTLAIIGHNPGIGMAASYLATTAPAHHRFGDYPTCATTILDFPQDRWMAPRAGKVVDFIVPRDLTDRRAT